MLAPLIAAVIALGLLLVPVIHSAAIGASDIPLFAPGQYTQQELTTSTLNDGIPDVWKVYYGLSISDPAVANADYNSSGIMNLEKYRLNIHPLASPVPPEPATPPKNVAKSVTSTAKAAPSSCLHRWPMAISRVESTSATRQPVVGSRMLRSIGATTPR